jgi:hypothetical protein
MMPTWNVRVSGFPLGAPGEVVGVVIAADRAEAEQKARDHFGAGYVTERATSSGADLHGLARTPRPRPDSTRRPMTASEAQMSRAVACCPMVRWSKHRAAMRALHARSLTHDRSISEGEATTLRACVVAFAAQLPASIVELARAGGAA